MKREFLQNPEEQPNPNNHKGDDLELRLKVVDHLLSSAPMLSPSARFAARVMEAVRIKQAEINLNASTGLALGLTLVVILVTSFAAAMLLGAINIMLNWTAVYQSLVILGGEISEAIFKFFAALQTIFAESPQIPAITLLAIPLFIVWLKVMQRLVPAESLS